MPCCKSGGVGGSELHMVEWQRVSCWGAYKLCIYQHRIHLVMWRKCWLANKCEMEAKRVVTKAMGEEFGAKSGIPFLETSCKTNHNIKEVISLAVKTLMFLVPNPYLDIAHTSTTALDWVPINTLEKCMEIKHYCSGRMLTSKSSFLACWLQPLSCHKYHPYCFTIMPVHVCNSPSFLTKA